MNYTQPLFYMFYVYYYWFCAVVGIVGIITNITICYVIIKTKELHTTLNYYLLSLAVSDCFNAVTELIAGGLQFFPNSAEINKILTEINSCNNFVVSNLTLSAMAVDRYIAVCHPLKARYLSKMSRTIKLILVVWTFSIFYCTSNVVKEVLGGCKGGPICFVLNIWGSPELYMVVLCLIPSVVIIGLYILIGLKIRKFGVVSKQSNIRNTSSTRESTARSGLLLSVAVVVEFLICSVPYQVILFMTINYTNVFRKSAFLLCCLIIARLLNVVAVIIDPVIFNYFSSKFRKAFTDLVETKRPVQSPAANVELRALPTRHQNVPPPNE